MNRSWTILVERLVNSIVAGIENVARRAVALVGILLVRS